LVKCLNDREELIKQRIKAQIDHLGVEERILFEKRDWTKENERMGEYENIFGDNFRIEDINAVSE
jgi:hypothetical protein